MEHIQIEVLAGAISTFMFAAGNVPMLTKVLRTRDLRSYSLMNLILSNIGNLIHWFYIASLPFGPVWVLHGYFTVTTALMLALYLRYRHQKPQRKKVRGRNADIFQTQEMYAV